MSLWMTYVFPKVVFYLSVLFMVIKYAWIQHEFDLYSWVNLDCSEQVHWSKKLGEWNTVIDHIMGLSLVGIYIMDKTSSVENFKQIWKNDIVANIATFFARGIRWWSSFLGNIKSSYKKFKPLENSNFMPFFNFFCYLVAWPIMASNNLVLG